MTLTELIAALEAADGPSRGLDAEIAKAAGWHRVEPRFSKGKHGGWIAPEDFLGITSSGAPVLDSLHGTTIYRRPPPFTGSIDAARTLSDWVLIHAGDISADGLAQVVLGNPDTTPAGEVGGIHPRLEIAWCIAALKTRETKE